MTTMHAPSGRPDRGPSFFPCSVSRMTPGVGGGSAGDGARRRAAGVIPSSEAHPAASGSAAQSAETDFVRFLFFGNQRLPSDRSLAPLERADRYLDRDFAKTDRISIRDA